MTLPIGLLVVITIQLVWFQPQANFYERHYATSHLSSQGYVSQASAIENKNNVPPLKLMQSTFALAFQKLVFSLSFLAPTYLLVFLFSQLSALGLILMHQHPLKRALLLILALFYCIPTYVMAPFVIEHIGLRYHFPFHQSQFSSVSHYLLPLWVIFYGGWAIYTRLSYSFLHEQLTQSYYLALKSLGVARWRVLLQFAQKQALANSIPLFLNSISFFLSLLIVVEVLFEIRGFGAYFYQCLLARNSMGVTVCLLLSATLVSIGHALSDVMTYKLDPRLVKHGY